MLVNDSINGRFLGQTLRKSDLEGIWLFWAQPRFEPASLHTNSAVKKLMIPI